MKKQIKIKKFNNNNINDLIVFSDKKTKKLRNIDIKKLEECCWFLRQYSSSDLEKNSYLYYEIFILEHQDTDFKCYLEKPELNTCKFCFCDL